jgi:glycosyltransferase involved in cell wall biosynthesis
MPKVSVTIPVYNAAPYLRECLDSVLGQTLADIEVFCVDDGSTDESPEILKSYALKDSRVTVLQQHNAGAGVARNMGLDRSSGEFLSFLDADDVFEPTMFEEMIGRCVADDADLCICKTRYLDTATGEFVPADGILRCAHLPGHTPFSWEDMPEQILSFVSPAAWNKLFRRDFVIEQGLRFQEIRRTNDYLFTKLALVRARRITVADAYLANYRVGMDSNLQASNHETPKDFYTAILALRAELVDSGIFSSVERSFKNEALSNCLYNLNSLRDGEAFCGLFEFLRDECFPELGIAEHPAEYFFSESQYEQYSRIVGSTPEQYLLDEARRLRAQLQTSREQVRGAREQLTKSKTQLRKLRESRAYRVGQKLASVPRFFRRLVSPRKKAK